METEKHLGKDMARVSCEIPIKMPSLNTYINACRRNRFVGAKMKSDLEEEIGLYVCKLPRFENPVRINFLWIEENRRRDLDNVSGSRKFILDALVKAGVLPDDSPKYVRAFTDTFGYAKEAKVILEIEQMEEF